MNNYHINPKTGRPNKCQAEKQACPLGGAHYATKAEARAGYEKAQASPLPQGLKRSPSGRKSYDIPLPGMRLPNENLAKEQARRENNPMITLEEKNVDGSWVTDINANGKTIFTAIDSEEIDTFYRAKATGNYSKIKELMADDESALNELHGCINFNPAYDVKNVMVELKEDVKELEDELAVKTFTHRQRMLQEQSIDINKLAISILKAEAKVDTPSSKT